MKLRDIIRGDLAKFKATCSVQGCRIGAVNARFDHTAGARHEFRHSRPASAEEHTGGVNQQTSPQSAALQAELAIQKVGTQAHSAPCPLPLQTY